MVDAEEGFSVTLALASVFALGGAKAMQQSADSGQASGQVNGQPTDGQIEMTSSMRWTGPTR